MKLEHGTREEHLGTLERAQEAGIKFICSSDVRRNRYLQENLAFGIEEGIIKAEFVELYEQQMSGWELEFL